MLAARVMERTPRRSASLVEHRGPRRLLTGVNHRFGGAMASRPALFGRGGGSLLRNEVGRSLSRGEVSCERRSPLLAPIGVPGTVG